jgi:hypothetical protein
MVVISAPHTELLQDARVWSRVEKRQMRATASYGHPFSVACPGIGRYTLLPCIGNWT